MADKDFLGKGMKFPPQINAATGRFETVSEDAAVRQSIYMILMTQITERPMRPEFGSNLMNYAFMDINQGSIYLITRSITEQIVRQEPRVEDVQVNADTGGRSGVVVFDISYRLSSTGSVDNLVFPFYLNRQTEEEEEREAEEYEPETIDQSEY